VIATAGTKLISLSGGIIPASASPPIPVGSCVITVQVTAPANSTASTSTNIIPAGTLTVDQTGITNSNDARAGISVYPIGTGLDASKVFNPNTIDPGQSTRLRINLRAPEDTDLTNFSITDNLPPGVTITNSTGPNVNNGCGAGHILTAVTGATTISLTNGTILAGQLCRIDVWVTSSTPGLVTNSIAPTNVSNNENRVPDGNIEDDLTVRQLSDLNVTKAFYPDQVTPNGISTLMITLENTNANDLINVSLTDNLGTMGGGGDAVRIAPTPNASTTCGGTLTAVAGTQNIILSGGTVPAQSGGIPGLCTISVDVQAGSNISTNGRLNRIPTTNVSGDISGTGSTINASEDAIDRLYVLDLAIGVVKGFDPVLVYGGASSTMSVQLINPNNATLVGISFTDDMTLLGTGMIIANPANLNVGTCQGALTGNPGDTSFLFSGGILPPNSSCTLTLSATMTVNGNLTNRIPAGAVTTLNGVSSPEPTEASLTNLPGASVSKVFSPNPINAGDYSLLTIMIQNTGSTPITGMRLSDTLPGSLPDGLEIAGAPAPINNCGGSLTAVTGTQLIELVNGSLAGNSSCTIVVAVTGNTPGDYQNNIPVGALSSNEGTTNNTPAIDTLTVLRPGTASLGDFVWNDRNADGIQDVGEVGIDNVKVNLYADGTLIATTTTAGGGLYLFKNLTPGDYYVEFIPPTGYVISPQDQGGNNANDSDVDPVSGRTITTTVASGENDLTWDAGLYQQSSGGGGGGGGNNPPTPIPVTGGFLIPVTGFAPNVVSDLSNTPFVMYENTSITLDIPKLSVNIPIVGVPKQNGTWNVAWLGNQAGWLEGSAFPSWNGNSVLTSHVYLSNGKPGPFAKLHELQTGDKIVVNMFGQKYTFEVLTNATILPTDRSVMQHEERPWLTLVTCADYDPKTGQYKNRFIVRAVLVNVSAN
jgi:LPXTG-site transpeptidase (sortase) family protein